MEFKKYDKVKVSPEATGLGDWITGWIDEVSIFLNRVSVSVRYDKPDANGATGTVITNTGLIEKIINNPEMAAEILKKRLDKCIDSYQFETNIDGVDYEKTLIVGTSHITLNQLKRLSEEFGDDCITIFPNGYWIKIYIENNKKNTSLE